MRPIVRTRQWPLPVRAGFGAVLGWALVAAGDREVPQRWAAPVAAALLAVVAAGAPGIERRWRGRAVGTGGALAACAGVYACAPETTHIASIAVVVAVLAVAELTRQVVADWPLVVVAAALVIWAAIFGGVFRDSALIAGLASIGLVAAEPVAALLPGPRRGISRDLAIPVLFALQLGYGIAIARHAGLRDDVGTALAICGAAAVGLTIAIRLVSGRRSPR